MDPVILAELDLRRAQEQAKSERFRRELANNGSTVARSASLGLRMRSAQKAADDWAWLLEQARART